MSEIAQASIHKTAIVSRGAELAEDVIVGPGAIIEGGATIESRCKIGSYSLIASGAHLKKGVEVHHCAVVGSKPQDLKFEGEESKLVVGENTIIREFATLNRGTIERRETTIGDNCLLMTYSHVAHDCVLGSNVILANSVNLAGHIEIDDFAIIGGVVPIHQFVRIGKHAMIGGGFRVPKDVCPYALVGGYPLKVIGLNLIGLRRRKFSRELIQTLQEAFKILFFSDINTTQALEKIESEIEPVSELTELVEFVRKSERGLTK